MEWPGPLARPRPRRRELCGCGRAWQHVRFAPKSMSERSARNEKRSAEVECSVRPYLSILCPARWGSRTSPAPKGQGHYQFMPLADCDAIWGGAVGMARATVGFPVDLP